MERYFLGSNTKVGFDGFYDVTTEGIGSVYLIKGGAGTGKSSLIKKVLKRGEDCGLRCESWHCSGDPKSLDGVYIHDLDVAVIDATSPHAVEPKIPKIKDDIVNLLQYVVKDKLRGYKPVIEKLSNNKKECYKCGYEHLNIAFCHLSQNIRSVSSSMNSPLIVAKARGFAGDILADLKCVKNGEMKDFDTLLTLGDDGEKVCCNRGGRRVAKRFFRAITPDGIVAFDDHLKGRNVWWVKGETASVDLFLKTALNVVLDDLTDDINLPITIFYNPLDTSLVDGFMVGDVVVASRLDDVECAMIYDLRWYEGDFDKYALGRGKVKMKEEIDIAVDYFAKARNLHLGIEKYYISAMDFDGIDCLTEKLLDSIFN